MRDFQGGHADFTVQIYGGGSHSFTWKEVAHDPQTFLFLGLPTLPWCFDSVFKCVNDLNKLYVRVLQFMMSSREMSLLDSRCTIVMPWRVLPP